MTAPRPGIALPAALLLLLALGLATAGMLAVSTQEAAIASATELALRARLAAESALAATLAGWSPDAVEGLAPGRSRGIPAPPEADPEITVRLTVTRLEGGMLLLRGEAAIHRSGRVAARGRSGLLLGPPPAGIDPVPAAVRAAAVRATRGEIDGAPIESDCGAEPALPVAGVAVPTPDSVSVAATARIGGTPPVLSGIVGDARALIDRLAPLAQERIGGAVRLNDPACGAGGPQACAPLRYAPADVELRGGRGRGVLLAGGAVRLTQRAEFRGAIIAAGTVTVAEQSSVEGSVRGARVDLLDGGVRYSRCRLLDAVRRGPLARPTRAGERLWIPQF